MKMRFTCLMFFCAICLVASDKTAKTSLNTNQSAWHQWKHFDVNRITASIANDGPFADYREANHAGMAWPKGSPEPVIYTAGLWISGKHRPSDSIRVATQFYSSDFMPGPISGTFNTTSNDTAVAADPTDARYRVYKISKGDNEFNSPDYAEWPGDLGAPYIDMNQNGTWDKGTDKPKLIGDQTLWCIFNDLNTTNRRYFNSSKPMGLEVRALYYGFNSEGPLGDVMFIQWTIINKSDADYDSVVVGIFNDIDLGDPFDDVVGSDPKRSLTYFYNGDSMDGNQNFGFRKRVPACGFFLLQPNAELAYNQTQQDNIPIQSAQNCYSLVPVIKCCTSTLPIIPSSNRGYATEVFNIMNGLTNNGADVINPFTALSSKYIFDGDPVADSGWLYYHSYPTPYDNRSLVNAYPMTLMKGDTHTVAGAFAIAQGSDRFNSIVKLRRTVDAARELHSRQFRPLYSTNTRVYHVTAETKVVVTARNENTALRDITARVYNAATDDIVLTGSMHDDGIEDDSVANDKLYTATFIIPPSETPVYMGFVSNDSGAEGSEWENTSLLITSASLSSAGATVFKDNINNNGRAELGELIQFKIRLHNPNTFNLHNVKMTPLIPEVQFYYINQKYNFREIPPLDLVESDTTSYFLYIPFGRTEQYYRIPFKAEDESGNTWNVHYQIPLFQSLIAKQTKLRGKGNFEFEIAVADPSSIKNHVYSLSARDIIQTSGRFNFTQRIVVKDSTTGNVLTQDLKPDTNAYSLFTQPIIDGFKVISKRFVSKPEFIINHSVDSSRWNDVLVHFDTTMRLSSVHLGDLPSISISFSRSDGFIDSNNNKVRDSTEKILFDTTDYERAQKAYFYSKSMDDVRYKYLGFEYIPFAVYDVDFRIPQKLTVVVVKYDTLPLIDFSQLTNSIYIFAQAYDSTGEQYDDSTLTESFNQSRPLPYYYTLSIQNRNRKEYLQDTVTTFITYSHPFTSRDIFIFNPTTLASVPGNKPLPTSYALEQNYPNPFNPSTTIRYSLPKQSKVTLSIYNILGQRIATLLHEVKSAGNHTVQWNGQNETGNPVASGIYFYHIMADGFASTKKMLLLK